MVLFVFTIKLPGLFTSSWGIMEWTDTPPSPCIWAVATKGDAALSSKIGTKGFPSTTQERSPHPQWSRPNSTFVAIFIRFLQNNGNILFKVPFDASRRLAKENAFRFHRGKWQTVWWASIRITAKIIPSAKRKACTVRAGQGTGLWCWI